MRILHVTHELPPYEAAGTAIYTWNIARAQARQHDVFVFARLQDPEIAPYQCHTEQRDDLTIRFMNLADMSWSPFEATYVDRKAERIFRDYLEEVEPDIVHFQHVLGMGMGVIDAVREMGIPIVFTLHDFWAMCPMGQRMCYTDEQLCDPIDFAKCGPCAFGEGWERVGPEENGSLQANAAGPTGPRAITIRDRYAKRVMETPGRLARRPRAAVRAVVERVAHLLRPNHDGLEGPPPANPFEHRFHRLRAKLEACDLLITPSAFLRDEFIKHFGIPPDRIIHSANGMDFSYVKATPKSPSERLRFGFVGSIIRTKGPHVLVEAFLDAASRHPDMELHVHGAPNRWSGAYLEELQAMARGHAARDRVTFHGRFDNRRIGQVLADIDVLVVPSIWFENAPLTLNEAAMTGTPIVVSDRGGMLEFARANSYGRTFELGNPRDLARVLEELVSDRSLVAALAGDPPLIKSVADNATELLGVYERILQGTWRSPSIEQQTHTRGGILTG